jgi:hypothetical protein
MGAFPKGLSMMIKPNFASEFHGIQLSLFESGNNATLTNPLPLVNYKNLKLMIAGGYMWAGKAMDRFTGTYYSFGPYPTPINEEIKNPWAITWNLTYSF